MFDSFLKELKGIVTLVHFLSPSKPKFLSAFSIFLTQDREVALILVSHKIV
jgi:hypothetical protein